MKLIKEKWKDIALVIMAVVIIYMTAGVLTRQEEKVKEPTVLYVGHKEEALDNFSKQEAAKALVNTLKEVGKNRDGNKHTIEERIEIIEKNEDFSQKDILTDKAIGMLYYAEEFGKDSFNIRFTTQALLAYYNLLVDEIGEDFDISEILVDDLVYLDNKFMIAEIPLDLIFGSATGVAFQMQYDEGEWKLNPYSATMSLNLLGMIEMAKQ